MLAQSIIGDYGDKKGDEINDQMMSKTKRLEVLRPVFYPDTLGLGGKYEELGGG